jgi:glucan phosphoethanolaminetransferase (alkaline phosphatase superfamily)
LSEDGVLSEKSIAGWLLPGIALLAGVLGMTAVWVAVSTISNSPSSWLALVAAMDVALLMKLTNAPAGRARLVIAVLATATAIVLSFWLIVATQMGISLGMGPLASSFRLGPALACQLTRLYLINTDWIFLLASLPLAAILTRSPRKAS